MVSDSAEWPVRLLMREIMEPTEACRKLVEDVYRPLFENLLVIVDEIAQKPLERHQLQQIGFSIVGQCLFYHRRSRFDCRIAGDCIGRGEWPQ